MEQETPQLLGRYKYVLAAVVLILVFLLWNKPRTKNDCDDFNNPALVKACLSEIYFRDHNVKPTPTPFITGSVTTYVARMEFDNVSLDPMPDTSGKAQYILSGTLKNISGSDLRHIQITVYFYNYGDDPGRTSPVASRTVDIPGQLNSGEEINIKQKVADNDKAIPEDGFSWIWKITGAEVWTP